MSTDLENKPVRQSKKTLKLTKHGKITIGIAAAAVIALGVLFGALSFVPSDAVAGGVWVGDLKLSGMSLEEARKAVEEHSFDGGNKSLSIVSNGKMFDIEFEDIDLTVDSQNIAEQAFEVCHSDNIWANMFQAVRLKFSKKQLPVIHKADTLKLDTKLAEFGEDIYGKLVQHNIEVSDTSDKVVITPGISGCSMNFETARNEILESVSNLVFEKIPVTINKEEPKEIDVKSLADSIHREPKDAEFSVENNKAKIVEHIVGVQLDTEDAADKVSQIKEGGEKVEIDVIKTMPSITKSNLEAKLFNSTLSTFTTNYNKNKINRSKNVALAAEKINGYVMAPGGEFSYNDVVGKRTVANGFLNAPVYENGKSVDGIGGGVCQVSTTLYSAVLYADLEIVSRQNHSLPVSYVPLGQDATVADGSIDFVFKNNTEYPVKIAASASDGKMTISILGTKRDVTRTVKLEHTTVSQIPPTVKETQVAGLPLGTRVVTSKGKTGYVIKSTKYVYENGVLVETKSLGRSTYKMVAEEVNVGTGAAVAATPTPIAGEQSSTQTQQSAAAPAPTQEVTPPTDNTVATDDTAVIE